jgi:hypothetical protein
VPADTGKDPAFANNFQGGSTTVITLVNASDRDYSGQVSLRTEGRRTMWKGLLDAASFVAEKGGSPPHEDPA